MSREMIFIPKLKYEELFKNEKTNNDGEHNSSHNPSSKTGKTPIEDKQNTDSGINAKNEPLKKLIQLTGVKLGKENHTSKEHHQTF